MEDQIFVLVGVSPVQWRHSASLTEVDHAMSEYLYFNVDPIWLAPHTVPSQYEAPALLPPRLERQRAGYMVAPNVWLEGGNRLRNLHVPR